MPNTPQHNGIVKRRNRTLLDTMLSILENSSLLDYLWRGDFQDGGFYIESSSE